ncbi:MAG: glycosyltransferase [Balneolaceae bacterium]|nr:MAG: glycosyltransferase [Balneolaceae bacterium]
MDKIPAPKLSVIVPVYNVEHYLRDALMSLLNQTFSGFELIAINDGSTDGSGEILREMAHSDSRIHFIQQENRGLAATRNRGLAESRGKYIYFFDSDDLLEVNAFKKMISYAENRSVDVLNIGSEAIDDKGKATDIVKPMQFDQPHPVNGEELFVRLYMSGNYPANVQKYLYRKDFLTDHRLNFDEGFIHEDEAFSLKTLCLAKNAGALPDRFFEEKISFRFADVIK